MLVMRAVKHPANSVGKLVCSEQSLRFDHLALGMHPLRLDGVKPRASFGEQAAHDPHSLARLFDPAIELTEPPADLFGDVPAGVVPDENHDLGLSESLELLAAPRKEPPRYGRNRPAIHEPDPRLFDLGKIESVAGYGLRSFAGIVFGERLLDEARWVALLAPGVQSGHSQPAPPEHSSKKPTAQLSGSAPAISISRSRLLCLLFSFVEGIGSRDPPFRPHPPHRKEARQSSPDGLSREPLFGETLLESDIGGHLQ